MSSITDAAVRQLAKLARLELTEEEVSRFGPQLRAILAFAQQIDTVDTASGSGAEGDAIPAPLRDDEIRPGLPRDEILAAAPAADTASGLFKVPRVLGD